MNKTYFLNKLVLVFFLSAVTFAVNAQDDKSKRKSPPAQATAKVNGVTVTIDYSQPSKNDRTIWGGLIKYDKVWRTGANEATTFNISSDVKINGKLLKAGKYGLFTIPGKEEWTIIFNNVPEQWGSGSYDASKDELRVKVKPAYGNPSVEKFTIEVDKKGNVNMKWDDALVSFKVS